MSWRDEKADYLQKSRDFSFLHGDDRGSRDTPRSKKVSDDRVPDNQEARDRLLRLKALEKQRADKQKKQYVGSPSPERGDRYERRETERNLGPSGSKRPPVKDNFGSFFGKVEKVVAKRVVDEQRAREIAARAAREARAAEAEKAAKARTESRNGSSMRPPSRPAAKPKSVNPVAVKAQKLKDNRDYSFLFSDEPPSKPEGRDSRSEPSKTSKDVRGSAEGLAKPKSAGTPSQKAKPASNGGLRPQGSASGQARKAGSSTSRPGSGGERDRNSRCESERRTEKDSRYASGGRAERDTRESRYDSERRSERSVPSSRVGSASKSGLDERPSSRGGASKLPLASDRAKRDGQERAKSLGPKATNHDRAVSRDSLSMKQSKVTQSSTHRISQSGNGGVRERMVQKSTDERRVVSQSVQKGSAIHASSAMKRKVVGEPAKKASINAKSNDGRRVERSRYNDPDSDPDSEMRKLVAGGPRPGASSRIVPATVNGLKRRPSDELNKKPLDVSTRRPMAEEPMRRKSGGNEPLPRKSSDDLRRRASDEPMRSRPAPAKAKKRVRDLEDSEYESDSDGGRRVQASGVSELIHKLFRYNPNKYKDLDDEDDKNMETSFRHIQAEEKRSARLAREEDEREQELIEEEERQERLRKLKRQKSR